ncbi:hypothetical protein CBR_g32623 [Chara braunii]|uniref:Uncharacterized protein n=1 Tax=Chara braunii TaxID=69332 RepID=A0A388LH14_CHABU|nr:hypothetical protein CBR_g32623 [Chara braunii]|eukprot:GBG81630.1 hypothetical protein CBR_g32623 [Chara braunii]
MARATAVVVAVAVVLVEAVVMVVGVAMAKPMEAMVAKVVAMMGKAVAMVVVMELMAVVAPLEAAMSVVITAEGDGQWRRIVEGGGLMAGGGGREASMVGKWQKARNGGERDMAKDGQGDGRGQRVEGGG